MDAATLRGRVDFGIITILEDELGAVLERFPKEDTADGPARRYRIRRLPLPKGGSYTLAVTRCAEQGNTDALNAARQPARRGGRVPRARAGGARARQPGDALGGGARAHGGVARPARADRRSGGGRLRARCGAA